MLSLIGLITVIVGGYFLYVKFIKKKDDGSGSGSGGSSSPTPPSDGPGLNDEIDRS
jgi:hypothetical protein